jgi:hypothetical protein
MRNHKFLLWITSLLLLLSTTLPALQVSANTSSVEDESVVEGLGMSEDGNYYEDEHYQDDEYFPEFEEYTDEELEKLGAESYQIEDDTIDSSYQVKREDFETEEEYKAALETVYGIGTIQPRAIQFLIPAALPVISKIGGKILVRQYKKSSWKNITVNNYKLAGKTHSSGVRFSRDGFPQFTNYGQITLPTNLLKSTNATQFNNANAQLYLQILKNPNIAKHFTLAERNLIKNGTLPSKFVWHHHQNTGVLQVVNRQIHSKTGHTGGRAIWGTL